MKVRHEGVEEHDYGSPKGRFGITYRDKIDCETTGCPFDLQHVTLKPGRRNFPFHSHGALWELYYALSGTATMRTDEETVDIAAGDCYLCRPGLAHQIINESDEDFVYLVISNDPPYDACYYPDSGKLSPFEKNLWGAMPEGRRFWQPLEETDYFAGEE